MIAKNTDSLKSFSIVVVVFLIVMSSVDSFSQYSKIQITTKLKEKFFDRNGNPLTGKGVLVGDVDSGVDVFHPMFFFADGGEFNFIDKNKDGVFTPGKDAVDLNKNGKADKNETLGYIEMQGQLYDLVRMIPDEYDADMDFLYVDKNKNGRRDFGVKDGFTENDPTYGEQLLIAIDKNGNNVLNKGEKIVALKTSKIRAVREKNGTIRKRGVDLIMTEPDTAFGHGTSVAGTILGGTDGVQKIQGIAPGAEIVIATIKYNYTPRFVSNFPDLLRFLRSENVNIILIEDGEWGWEFMDGSSEEEQLMDEYAREGITIVGGAGNLAEGKMHIKDTLAKDESETYIIKAAKFADQKLVNGVFPSIIWNDSDGELKFEIETPDNLSGGELTGNNGSLTLGEYHIYFDKEISPKGIAMMKFGFSKADSGDVQGEWKIKVSASNETVINGYVTDVTQSWLGGVQWTSHLTSSTTVTFPVTCDSIISVGAYAVNYGWNEKVGDLATYSSRGVNIDGKLGIGITAPGHTSFSAGINNEYVIFSGTSSAAPHVVGTAALMLQYDPSLTHSQISEILFRTAVKDQFTGDVPNPDWGWGKLNIEAAIKFLQKDFYGGR